ncbi:MAG: TrkH family potassium uptake protein [Clostridia bacterium]|nr:TrkH family potassium uptake protein [Clostridia bacterium]
MNYKMVLRTVGKLLQAEALLLLLPMAVSIYYKENFIHIYGVVIAILLGVGTVMTIPKPDTRRIYAREGFAIVSFSWILLSFFGALPFVLSGQIPSIVDAMFEVVSGFTTTGATILPDVERMSRSLLFWRAFTHWLGGMGIIVFVLAFLPQKDMQSMHIMRAEVPGPSVGKLVSKTTVTARILYILYGALTVAEIIALLCCDMPLFDSVTTAFATAGTGGFSVKNASIAAYNSLSIEIVVSLFMLLFGVNFNLYYLMIMKQFKRAIKSEELWTYVGIVAVSIGVIAINIVHLVGSFGEALRQAGFQVASLITTTGFGTADFGTWPTLSQFIVIMLMFCGACTGSTGGGLKVGRIMILVKSVFRELRRAINPKSVKCIKLDGAVVDKEVISTTSVYFTVYMLLIGVSTFLISFDNIDLLGATTSVISCINNIGPGLSSSGMISHFADYSDFSKIIFTADMLIGRLEIFPMLILFLPSTWRKSA